MFAAPNWSNGDFNRTRSLDSPNKRFAHFSNLNDWEIFFFPLKKYLSRQKGAKFGCTPKIENVFKRGKKKKEFRCP